MKKYLNFLNELLVHPDFKYVEDEKEYILSYKKYIYFVNEDELYLALNDMGYEVSENIQTFDIHDEYPDIIVLNIESYNTLIYSLENDFSHNFQVSENFIKTLEYVKQYGYRFLEIYENFIIGDKKLENHEEYEISKIILKFKEDLKYKKIPDIVYHGTCSEYLNSIIKTGLRAGLNSNFQKIYNKNKYLFFSAKKSDAIFYSDKCANNTNSFPIILEIDTKGFNISKIKTDYDFYVNYIGQGNKYYDNIFSKFPNSYINDKNKTLKHLEYKYIGATYNRFAYSGHLYPKFIKKIFYSPIKDDLDFEYELNSREDIEKFIEMTNYFNEFGYFYDEGNYELDWDYYQEFKKEMVDDE